jgi:ketosteroid isomerase-like protein
MRTWMWLILLAGLGSGPVLWGQSAAAPAARDVLALEEQWAGALRERNEIAFAKFLAEDLRHIGFEGQIVGKRDYMAFFKTGDWKYSEYTLVDPQVAIEGCAAIVIGRIQRRIVVNGKETSGMFAFTHVWARRGGEWRVIASQVTASPTAQ